MPTYEYRCIKCGEDLEAYQSFSEEPLKKHVGCGGKLTRVMSSVGIVLKGSGFYKTDNRDSTRGKSRDETSSTSAESSPSAGASDSSGSETRSADSAPSSTDAAKPTASGEKQNGSKKSGAKKSPVKSA
jgi:putative FmdB family regulatory protein